LCHLKESYCSFDRHCGNYLNIKEGEKFNAPEGRQRLINKLYEIMDGLNQVINDYSAERQVVIDDILVDERVVNWKLGDKNLKISLIAGEILFEA
jgi:hypothetical protein